MRTSSAMPPSRTPCAASDDPQRQFLPAASFFPATPVAHSFLIRGRHAEFSRVYAHFSLLVINLALWFLSLFGYFKEKPVWSDNEGERLLFSLLWTAVSGVLIFAGARLGLKFMRGYGITFLIINLYTFYFQFVASNTSGAWFLHLLLMGGSLVWLGFHLEKKRKQNREKN
ncbi:MAG: hypothetical protein PHV34_06750 [Verrucomicrobiae bacterium]|nr:hypothetical protein [Verrucomicrobiae bacterium]